MKIYDLDEYTGWPRPIYFKELYNLIELNREFNRKRLIESGDVFPRRRFLEENLVCRFGMGRQQGHTHNAIELAKLYTAKEASVLFISGGGTEAAKCTAKRENFWKSNYLIQITIKQLYPRGARSGIFEHDPGQIHADIRDKTFALIIVDDAGFLDKDEIDILLEVNLYLHRDILMPAPILLLRWPMTDTKQKLTIEQLEELALLIVSWVRENNWNTDFRAYIPGKCWDYDSDGILTIIEGLKASDFDPDANDELLTLYYEGDFYPAINGHHGDYRAHTELTAMLEKRGLWFDYCSNCFLTTFYAS